MLIRHVSVTSVGQNNEVSQSNNRSASVLNQHFNSFLIFITHYVVAIYKKGNGKAIVNEI